MRVLIVDDHPVIQQVLQVVLDKAIENISLSFANSLDGALAEAKNGSSFDLVLLDLGLPGCKGVDALRLFSDKAPDTRVVVFSANEDPETIRTALLAGAAGYIPKTYKPSAIVAALRVVAEGGTYVPREILDVCGEIAPSTLTDREREVLQLLLRGLNNRNIGRQLHIAESTVKQHLGAIYGALGVKNRAEAMAAVRSIKP